MSEARKYKLNLIVANQFVAQIEEEVKNAVFGNVGTLITFRVGVPDATFAAQLLRFTEGDLTGDSTSCEDYCCQRTGAAFSMDLTRDGKEEHVESWCNMIKNAVLEVR